MKMRWCATDCWT